MLCEGARYGSETAEVVETFRRIIAPWADVPLSHRSGWRSDISDDGTPIEFSVTIEDGRPEVRVLFEVQGEEPTLKSQRAAGLAFLERVEREYGAELSRLRMIEDLFLAPDMSGTFALWSSIVFAPGEAPQFKVYLNPQARGLARSQALVEEALLRLGFPQAWPMLAHTALRRGPRLDEIKYFALDLGATKQARFKVYVNHHLATADELEIAASAAVSYTPGEATRFMRAMSGGVEQLVPRSAFTCSNFVSGGQDRPAATTIYVPVCAYARDDAAVRSRVAAYLREHSGDASTYEHILDAFANRPLETGTGMHSWVAIRRYQGELRFTIYLGIESRRVFGPGAIPAPTIHRTRFVTAEHVTRQFELLDISQHPFLQRLLREPPNPAAVWLLIHNTYEGTSKHFIRWLASLTAQVENEEVRCLLARQLYQEMGEGDFSRAHSVLMRSFLEGLSLMKPAHLDDEDFEAGRRLGTRFARHYLSQDWYESLAALIAGEICAHQLIFHVARLLRQQVHALQPAALTWLQAHEELEGGHADESMVLAGMVPSEPAALEGMLRGTSGIHSALWGFLHEMYELCYSNPSRTARLLPLAAQEQYAAPEPSAFQTGSEGLYGMNSDTHEGLKLVRRA
jgi:pyrroloquinoline quinone (PQQ) biosynthesis protein C